METIVIALLVVVAMAYAVVALRREVRPSPGGGCACDCPQAEKCSGSSCPVIEGALSRPPDPKRPPAA
jgi:hypothetical protein